MAVRVLLGDSFLIEEVIESLKADIGTPELFEANHHAIPGQTATFENLRIICDTLPFLARSRLVVVEGFLQLFDRKKNAKGGLGKDKSSNGDEWEKLEEYLANLPTTTNLVFADNVVDKKNAMLEKLSKVVSVEELRTPVGIHLSQWIKERAHTKGSKISEDGIRLLKQYVGGSLRILDNELEKLSTYSMNNTIGEADVTVLVTEVRESSIFPLIDAILARRQLLALSMMYRLRVNGASLSYIFSMIARQIRLVTLAKDLINRGVPRNELGRRLGLTAEFALKKTLDLARTFTWPGVLESYRSLLLTDLKVKQGVLDEDIALYTLINEMTSTTRGG